MSHGQLRQSGARPPQGAAPVGAALILTEQLLGPLLVAIDLPQSGTLEAAGLVLDEAPYILRGIAEEQPDLVGEFVIFPQTADETGHALPGAVTWVPGLLQQAHGLGILQILPQAAGPVEVQQRTAAVKAKGQQTQALARQQTVDAAHLLPQLLRGVAGTGEQAAGLDPGQSRGALTHHKLLRHDVSPPYPACFSRMFRRADRELV